MTEGLYRIKVAADALDQQARIIDDREAEIERLRAGLAKLQEAPGPEPCSCIRDEGGVIHHDCWCGSRSDHADAEMWCRKARTFAYIDELLRGDG